MKTLSSTEERVWAMLSHLSALAFGMGLLIPIVAWSDQRRKSNYVAFQALQALGYQSLGYTLWFVVYLLIVVLFVIMLFILGLMSGGDAARLTAITPAATAVFFILMFATFGIYSLFPIIAAIMCALGQDFRYPIMGHRLARYLHHDPERIASEPVWLFEENESRWLAAMGHFSVIIMLWGLLAPAAALIMAGARSRFLKFQSIQTLIYQTAVTALFIGGMSIYVVGVVLGLGIATATAGPTFQSASGIAGTAILLLSFCCAAVILLVVPLCHILGQWAGYRVIKGDDYRYPLVGRLTERWFMKSNDSHL